MAKAHNKLMDEYVVWSHEHSALLFNMTPQDWVQAYARGCAFASQPAETFKPQELRRPRVTTKYADFHHVHFMCPRPLWLRFRQRFPNKGDVQIRLVEALTVYVDLLAESEKHAKEAASVTTE